MNRGSSAYVNDLDLAKSPSMRPRFMNRGSAEASQQETPIGAPSMRPRFMNRGSVMREVRKRLGITPFNEAPIHESGKFSAHVYIVPKVYRLQ